MQQKRKASWINFYHPSIFYPKRMKVENAVILKEVLGVNNHTCLIYFLDANAQFP